MGKRKKISGRRVMEIAAKADAERAANAPNHNPTEPVDPLASLAPKCPMCGRAHMFGTC